MNDKKIIPLEEVLRKFNKHNADFIDNINKEEARENLGSVNSIERNIKNEIKAIKYSTELKKNNFINELNLFNKIVIPDTTNPTTPYYVFPGLNQFFPISDVSGLT